MSQRTDAQLTTEAQVIRDETVELANTKLRVYNILKNIVDSKVNNDDAASSVWGDITGTITDQADLVAYVAARIAALVDSSPVALDTLNELASALGDDPNFATTVINALAGKQATLVSGTNIKTVNGTTLLGSGNISTTVPDADATTKGIAKLYTSTGSSTDGSMDRNSITNALALKAPLASPAFTGVPTAPTAAVGTSTTQLATTQFVDQNISKVGMVLYMYNNFI